MCDTQNNIVVDHVGNDAKKVHSNQLYHNFSKDARQRNDSQFNACPKYASNNGDTQRQQEKTSHPRKSAFFLGSSIINDYLKWMIITSFVNYKYIVKVRPFVTGKTDDLYDHIK